MKVEFEVQISDRICITEELKLELNSILVLSTFSCTNDHIDRRKQFIEEVSVQRQIPLEKKKKVESD